MNSIPHSRPVDGVPFDLYGTLVDIQLDEDSAALWAGLGSVVHATPTLDAIISALRACG